MTFNRQCMVLLLAGGCWCASVAGQESGGATGGSAGGGTGGGGTGGGGAPVPAAESADPGSFLRPATSGSGDGSGASSSFGAPLTSPPGGLGATGGGEPATGASSSGQGVGFGSPKVPTEQPSFTLPGFYGATATTFTAGEGRLARPRFRYNVSLAVGYDDNVFQTPENGGPEQFELVSEPEPPRLEPRFEDRVFLENGLQVTRRVQVGFREIPAKDAVLRSIPAQEKAGSFVTRAGGQFDMQIFTRRSLVTFDVNANADYNWNRPGPGTKTDYNGSVVLNTLYRFSPRFQFTTAVNAAYLSQPDFSRINTPQDQQPGSAYVTANAKLDLSYRWTPRFTSVVSLSDNALFYQETEQQDSDYNETLFGTELRYLWSPKLTVLGEARYSQITYAGDTTRNATTAFLLIGAEGRVTPRLTGTIRIGQALRTFEESGDASATPYAETSVSLRLGPLSVVSWTTRFGFEEPSSAEEERQTFRTGLSYTQVFSPRLNGVASVNYIHQTITQTSTESETSSNDDVLDANLRLEYAVTRRFLLNASYSFTDRSTSNGFGDYYRNRVFFGGEYTF